MHDGGKVKNINKNKKTRVISPGISNRHAQANVQPVMPEKFVDKNKIKKQRNDKRAD